MEPNQTGVMSSQIAPESSLGKILLIGVGVVVFVAVVGGFFYSKKSQITTSEMTSSGAQQQNATNSLTTTSQSGANLKDCFAPYEMSKPLDTSDWTQFGGAGFSIAYPSNKVSVSLGENGNYVIAQRGSVFKATVHVQKLKEGGFQAHHINTPSVAYEFRSNTWWPNNYLWNPDDAPCNPNSVGTTNDGKHPIYVTGDGDVGVSFTTYFIVLRDAAPTDNYEPIVISFTLHKDGNDPQYEGVEQFEAIIQTIIRTLQPAPVTLG